MNENLIKAAGQFFINFPEQTKCFGTDDGNVFFEKDKTFAINHANEVGQNWYEITPALLNSPATKPAKTTTTDADTNGGLNISKKALEILEGAGINPATVIGTGANGQITKTDADKALAAQSAEKTATEETTNTEV